MAKEITYIECDMCGHYHPLGFAGDCRDNANRLTQDQFYELEINQENERNWNHAQKVRRNKNDDQE